MVVERRLGHPGGVIVYMEGEEELVSSWLERIVGELGAGYAASQEVGWGDP